MRKLEIEHIELPEGCEADFYCLWINGRCSYHDFIRKLGNNQISKIGKAKLIMTRKGNGEILPKQLLRNLGKAGDHTLHEIKPYGIRLYVADVDGVGTIVVYATKKPNLKRQSTDIEKARSIAMEIDPNNVPIRD